MKSSSCCASSLLQKSLFLALIRVWRRRHVVASSAVGSGLRVLHVRDVGCSGSIQDGGRRGTSTLCFPLRQGLELAAVGNVCRWVVRTRGVNNLVTGALRWLRPEVLRWRTLSHARLSARAVDSTALGRLGERFLRVVVLAALLARRLPVRSIASLFPRPLRSTAAFSRCSLGLCFRPRGHALPTSVKGPSQSSSLLVLLAAGRSAVVVASLDTFVAEEYLLNDTSLGGAATTVALGVSVLAALPSCRSTRLIEPLCGRALGVNDDGWSSTLLRGGVLPAAGLSVALFVDAVPSVAKMTLGRSLLAAPPFCGRSALSQCLSRPVSDVKRPRRSSPLLRWLLTAPCPPVALSGVVDKCFVEVSLDANSATLRSRSSLLASGPFCNCMGDVLCSIVRASAAVGRPASPERLDGPSVWQLHYPWALGSVAVGRPTSPQRLDGPSVWQLHYPWALRSAAVGRPSSSREHDSPRVRQLRHPWAWRSDAAGRPACLHTPGTVIARLLPVFRRGAPDPVITAAAVVAHSTSPTSSVSLDGTVATLRSRSSLLTGGPFCNCLGDVVYSIVRAYGGFATPGPGGRPLLATPPFCGRSRTSQRPSCISFDVECPIRSSPLLRSLLTAPRPPVELSVLVGTCSVEESLDGTTATLRSCSSLLTGGPFCNCLGDVVCSIVHAYGSFATPGPGGRSLLAAPPFCGRSRTSQRLSRISFDVERPSQSSPLLRSLLTAPRPPVALSSVVGKCSVEVFLDGTTATLRSRSSLLTGGPFCNCLGDVVCSIVRECGGFTTPGPGGRPLLAAPPFCGRSRTSQRLSRISFDVERPSRSSPRLLRSLLIAPRLPAALSVVVGKCFVEVSLDGATATLRSRAPRLAGGPLCNCSGDVVCSIVRACGRSSVNGPSQSSALLRLLLAACLSEAFSVDLGNRVEEDSSTSDGACSLGPSCLPLLVATPFRSDSAEWCVRPTGLPAGKLVKGPRTLPA
eukprot:scaffold306_cov525-Prasinococcus_capsulatus_cf.AAC.11